MTLVKSLSRAFVAVVVTALVTTTVAFAADVVPSGREQITLTFAPVVKRVAPAVVNIYARKIVRTRALAQDPFFQRFFGGSPFGVPRQQIENALGSGVLIRADGIVVTNNHVIDGADEIKVVLQDRREFAARLIGTDQQSDIAVLRLEGAPQGLPTVALGSTDALEVGDVVLALGNPFGVGQTVTMGIVSALARTTAGEDGNSFNAFIQTDAAINPGNSGGALVTQDGRLVGINSMIYSRDGGNMGIGFAIPVEMVKAVVAGLLNEGKVVHPWFGAEGQAVSPTIASSLGLDRPGGVLINSVTPGSGAADAGLRTGDVVTAVDGHEVADPAALRYRIATGEIGATLTLTVIRDGRTLSLALPLSAPPEQPPRAETVVRGENPLQGARVANENPALASELGIVYRPGAVIVLAVNDQGYAARLGIQEGDIIQSVNGVPVGSVQKLQQSLAEGSDEGWALAIDRGGQILTVQVR